MVNKPRTFLSYSHSDKAFADKLADNLFESGIDLWVDKYEIRPGDSLIEKIFSVGLKNVKFFIILLSPDSIESKWVREELDNAMIQKIEGETRIIPLIIASCEIPPPLKAIKFIDLTGNYDENFRELIKTLYDVNDKPEIGQIPSYIRELSVKVLGLSGTASTVGAFLAKDSVEKSLRENYYTPREIHKSLMYFSATEINDALDELKELGLIEVRYDIGSQPYKFSSVQPTCHLYLYFSDTGILGYDATGDLKMIANIVASKNETEGEEIAEKTGLSSIRINRAVQCLDDNGIIDVSYTLGVNPYTFGHIRATRETREFVRRFR